MNEKNILKDLNNSNIIHLKQTWSDKTYYYFLFDYAINKDLSHFLVNNGKNHFIF